MVNLELKSLGLIGYTAGAATGLLLSIYLLRWWRERLDHVLLFVATVTSTLWCGCAAYQISKGEILSSMLYRWEVLRDAFWLIFLLQSINVQVAEVKWKDLVLRLAIAVGLSSMVLLLISILLFPPAISFGSPLGVNTLLLLGGVLLLSVGGLVAVVQLFRIFPQAQRTQVRLLCLPLGGLFGYDILIYVNAFFEGQISPYLWQSRGLVNGLALVLIALSIRTPVWSRAIHVSHVAIYSILGIAAMMLYVLVIGAGEYYMQIYGNGWGELAQIALLILGIMFLLALLTSKSLRVYLKVFIAKNFFRYKYDYREEWLRFIRVLSRGGAGAHLPEIAIQAIAQIVDASAGMLWLRAEDGSYHSATKWNLPDVHVESVSLNDSLAIFLENWQWVITIDEYYDEPDVYKQLDLPEWISLIPEVWLVVPLMQDVRLLGFIVVARPTMRRRLNWEDHDILKMAGRQAATQLAQMLAAQALTEAREFFAFSRLSAFVMHDLKNVIGQLSLLINNAAKFNNNPQFMVDAVKTIENSVIKMNRLLTQLSKGSSRDKFKVNLAEVVDEVNKARLTSKPVPKLECAERNMYVSANRDQLVAIIEHIVQNAQEATPIDGWVKLRLSRTDHRACIEIEDSGCGMDAKFIRDRLFRPFDTTKGQGGMGIGAFECRDYVRELGGEINVQSEPGVGTLFRIYLPLLDEAVSLDEANEVSYD